MIPYERLGDVVRYMKALRQRAERAKLDPGKDRQKRQQVEFYQDRLDELSLGENIGSASGKAGLEEFRWMLEEYRVSVFAQELGTSQPVSPKRLDRKLEEIATAG